MKSSLAVLATVGLLSLTLAACGDQSSPGSGADDPSASSTSEPTTPTDTPTATPTDASGPTIEHPTGADDVVLRINVGGGFVPASYSFTNQPVLLLTGDGRVFLPAAGRGGFDDRLLGIDVVQADEETVQRLLALADEHNLLQEPPSYDDLDGPVISDAPTTSVTIDAGGGTWQHDAYALAMFDDTRETGKRAELATFIVEATDLVDSEPSIPFEPSELRLFVEPFGGEPDNHSTVETWPAPEVDLATIGGCAVVPAAGLTGPLGDADSSTYFRQDDAVYAVSAAALLPGDDRCPEGF